MSKINLDDALKIGQALALVKQLGGNVSLDDIKEKIGDFNDEVKTKVEAAIKKAKSDSSFISKIDAFNEKVKAHIESLLPDADSDDDADADTDSDSDSDTDTDSDSDTATE